MAAHAPALARVERRAPHVGIDASVRAAVAGARPSLEEMLSLWSPDLRGRVVVRVTLGPGGEVTVGAQLRERPLEGEIRDLARDVQRIRDDVPVVLELEDGRTMVVPLRALTGAGA